MGDDLRQGPQITPLRLAHSLESLRPTLHNGPGWRIGIWVQGCSLLCTDQCLNPHFLASDGGYLYKSAEVTAAILRVASIDFRPVEGVTVLGGEPTDQAVALVPVLHDLQEAGFTTMVYTGSTLSALRLRGEPAIDALLAATDLLVDGPFIPKLYDESLPWRGSRNQRIHCLTQRYDDAALTAAYDRQGKGYSISVGTDSILSVSGLQERAAAKDIELGCLHFITREGMAHHG